MFNTKCRTEDTLSKASSGHFRLSRMSLSLAAATMFIADDSSAQNVSSNTKATSKTTTELATSTSPKEAEAAIMKDIIPPRELSDQQLLENLVARFVVSAKESLDKNQVTCLALVKLSYRDPSTIQTVAVSTEAPKYFSWGEIQSIQKIIKGKDGALTSEVLKVAPGTKIQIESNTPEKRTTVGGKLLPFAAQLNYGMFDSRYVIIGITNIKQVAQQTKNSPAAYTAHDLTDKSGPIRLIGFKPASGEKEAWTQVYMACGRNFANASFMDVSADWVGAASPSTMTPDHKGMFNAWKGMCANIPAETSPKIGAR